jgi:hypothetical protein
VTPGAYSGVLEAIERILNRGGESDEVLRQVERVLNERLGLHTRVRRVDGEAVTTPAAGAETSFPVLLEGAEVGELVVAGEPDAGGRALMERVAVLVSPYCLAR